MFSGELTNSLGRGWRISETCGSTGFSGHLALLRLVSSLKAQKVVHSVISVFRHREEQPPRWVVSIALFGWILVALGVAGEGVAEGFVSKADSNLQTLNDILLTDARKETALAFERAAEANRQARMAQGGVALANQRGHQLEKEAADARKETEKLRQQNLATEARLSDEHNKRMELEKTVAPRFIPVVNLPQKHLTVTDVLKKFAGMHAIVDCIPDWEARRAAGNIIALLTKAGWIIDSKAVVEKDFPDGVSIKVHWPVFDEEAFHAGRSGWPEEEDNSSDAGDELIAFLRANDWVVQTDLSEHRELKSNQVYVKVGYKPAPYFASEWTYAGLPLMPREKQRIEEIRKTLKNFWAEEDQVLKDAQHKH